MHNFKKLDVWDRSINLAVKVYREMQVSEMDNALRWQLTKTIISIPSNIAEGCGRDTEKQFINFLQISTGSCCELETQLLLAIELRFLEPEKIYQLISETQEIRKVLCTLINRTKQRLTGPSGHSDRRTK